MSFTLYSLPCYLKSSNEAKNTKLDLQTTKISLLSFPVGGNRKTGENPTSFGSALPGFCHKKEHCSNIDIKSKHTLGKYGDTLQMP